MHFFDQPEVDFVLLTQAHKIKYFLMIDFDIIGQYG